jgi:hypothetical protein
LVIASLILAFSLLASTHAAPNNTNVPATPAANALPATPAEATPAEPHPEIREALGALRARRRTWNTPLMILVGIAWMRYVPPMKPSGSWKSA